MPLSIDKGLSIDNGFAAEDNKLIAEGQGGNQRRMSDSANEGTQKPTTFSALLNYLFATRRKPDGKEYTLREVSQATGLPVPYLSNVRTGKIAEPPVGRAQALADFFGVNVGYFTGRYTAQGSAEASEPEREQDRALWEALRKPLVREVALRAGAMGTAERAIILEMIERAEQIARAAEAAEDTRAPDQGTGEQPPS